MEAKKIVITGSATRIGAAIAKSLADYDVKITLHYNKSAKEVKKLQVHKNKNKKEITNAKRKLTRTQNEIKKMEVTYENDDVEDAADFLRKFSKSK